ncbi:MAG TPA: ABC transporter substrate-binding protein, partial [Rhodopila sp.]|nr:ABC transporter substrate-binding protein [Rhodopila sp.]
RAQDVPGVTATEIRIGNTMPYSGPAAAYGTIGKVDTAVFKMTNGMGGLAGRKVDFISYNDHYVAAAAVAHVRQLVEQDRVLCLFNTLGTPTNLAIANYCNARGVPQLFIATGADLWGADNKRAWTIGWQPSYRSEAQIYAQYIQKTKPEAKLGILYQNDVFGQDYVKGVRDILKERFDAIVTTAAYDVSDTTIDSPLLQLHSSGAIVLLTAATPKFAIETIRKMAAIKWQPMHLLSGVAASAGAVMLPAGAENGIGIISSGYLKDPTDPRWDSDPGMREWRAFMAKFYPEGDPKDIRNVFAYGASLTMIQVLKQCGNDLSRRNILGQSLNLRRLECPVLLPGIQINTSPTNYHPVRQLQMMRWTGKSWDAVGDVIADS